MFRWTTYFSKDSKNNSGDDTWLQKKCCNASQLIYKGFHRELQSLIYFGLVRIYSNYNPQKNHSGDDSDPSNYPYIKDFIENYNP